MLLNKVQAVWLWGRAPGLPLTITINDVRMHVCKHTCVRTPMHKVGPPLQQFSLTHPQQCSIHPLSCLSHVDAFLLPVCSLYQNLHRVKQKIPLPLLPHSFLHTSHTLSFTLYSNSIFHFFLPSPPSRPPPPPSPPPSCLCLTFRPFHPSFLPPSLTPPSLPPSPPSTPSPPPCGSPPRRHSCVCLALLTDGPWRTH